MAHGIGPQHTDFPGVVLAKADVLSHIDLMSTCSKWHNPFSFSGRGGRSFWFSQNDRRFLAKTLDEKLRLEFKRTLC